MMTGEKPNRLEQVDAMMMVTTSSIELRFEDGLTLELLLQEMRSRTQSRRAANLSDRA